jgi:hypothetical protein
MDDRKELGTRELHFWRGGDRKADIDRLADSIAAAVPGLYNHNGELVQINPMGQLAGISRNELHRLIDRHIAGVRAVMRNGRWEPEYYSYPFAPKPRRGPPTWENPNPDAGSESEPDNKALDEIHRTELVWRLPSAE